MCWVFVSVQGLSSSCGERGPLFIGVCGPSHYHGLSCCGAQAPDQGSKPCPLHWQADSQPLRHQGSPRIPFLIELLIGHVIKRVTAYTMGGGAMSPTQTIQSWRFPRIRNYEVDMGTPQNDKHPLESFYCVKNSSQLRTTPRINTWSGT